MNILFHVGVGNVDRPARWRPIGIFYRDLASALMTLGHTCAIYIHPAATKRFKARDGIKVIVSKDVEDIDFKPDAVFTWNGEFKGDGKIVAKYGRDKCIFGELALFNHYNTCMFDAQGTNWRSTMMVETFKDALFDEEEFEAVVAPYRRPRLQEGRYVFVPLQDERDTQMDRSHITKMYNLLTYVLELYHHDKDIKILYKQHPKSKSVVPSHEKLIAVTENVHHYLPWAEQVIGINSTVLTECLMYHSRVMAIGLGMASRGFEDDTQRKKFILECWRRQIPLNRLGHHSLIVDSWMYNKLLLPMG